MKFLVHRFAIIVPTHPAGPDRSARPAVFARGWWGRFMPPRRSALIEVDSPSARAAGHLIALNEDVPRLQRLPAAGLLRKTVRAGKKASRLGARIIGFERLLLRALGPSALPALRALGPAVTSGAGCAAAAAIDGIGKAAGLMGIGLEEAEVLVVGAAQPFGSACARILAREGANYLTLIDGDGFRLERLANRVRYECGVACRIGLRIQRAAARADLIVIAGGEAAAAGFYPSGLKPGAVVCNWNAADEFTRGVINSRPDVMIFDQSILRLPGKAALGYDPALSGDDIPAPMAEPILLALEGRLDRFFIGPELRVEKVMEMRRLVEKHGFELTGFTALNRRFDFDLVRAIGSRRPA